MAKTVTLTSTANDESLYPLTLPQNVVDSNGNNILELVEDMYEVESSSTAGNNWSSFNLR